MKVKVFTIKDLIRYLAKISLIFGAMAIFAKFFYSNRNASGVFAFSSSKYVSIIDDEIVLLENNNSTEQKNPGINYASETIGGELSMFNAIAATNPNTLLIGNNETENVENDNGESAGIYDGQNAQQQNNEEFKEAQTGLNVEMLPSNIPDKTTYEVFGVRIRNESDYNIQNEIKDLDVEFNKNDVMIFHTHTCESYTPTEQFQYQSSGNFRTTDLNYSVARVGDELEKYLTNYGYNVVHDKTYHDYPAYNGSYDRSVVTVKNLLTTYTNTDMVIDLHRDAIGDNTYAPRVKIGDDYCARIMLVVGTDGGGLTHKNWRENVKIAIKLAQKADELYPGLFKPIIVRNSRYNHHLAKGACIIEVGATGNTLEECLNSMKYLSKIYNEM